MYAPTPYHPMQAPIHQHQHQQQLQQQQQQQQQHQTQHNHQYGYPPVAAPVPAPVAPINQRQQELSTKPQEEIHYTNIQPIVLPSPDVAQPPATCKQPFQPFTVKGMESGIIEDIDFLDVFEVEDDYDGDLTDEESENVETSQKQPKTFPDESIIVKEMEELTSQVYPPPLQPIQQNEQTQVKNEILPVFTDAAPLPQLESLEPLQLLEQTEQKKAENSPVKPKTVSKLTKKPKSKSKKRQRRKRKSKTTKPIPDQLLDSFITTVNEPKTSAWDIQPISAPPAPAFNQKSRKRKALRPSPDVAPAVTAVPVLRDDASNVDETVLSAADTKIPSIRKTNTSLEIFEQFVTRKMLPNGVEVVDASGILSTECFDLWLKTRRTPPKNPYEAFRKTLVARITVADKRSLPFSRDVEKSLLVELRKRRVWPCFQGKFTPAGKPILIGSNGLRARGFYEQGEESRSSKPLSTTTTKKRKLCSSKLNSSV